MSDDQALICGGSGAIQHVDGRCRRAPTRSTADSGISAVGAIYFPNTCSTFRQQQDLGEWRVPASDRRQCYLVRQQWARQHRVRSELQYRDLLDDGGIGRMIRGRWGTHFKTVLGDRSGVAAVEFAIIVPVLLALTMGVIDFGMYIGTRIELEQALRAGGQYALKDPTDAPHPADRTRPPCVRSPWAAPGGRPHPRRRPPRHAPSDPRCPA